MHVLGMLMKAILCLTICPGIHRFLSQCLRLGTPEKTRCVVVLHTIVVLNINMWSIEHNIMAYIRLTY